MAFLRSSHSFHSYDLTMLDSMKWVSVCVPVSHFVTGLWRTPSLPPCIMFLWQSKICKSFWNLFWGEICMFFRTFPVIYRTRKTQLQHSVWNFLRSKITRPPFFMLVTWKLADPMLKCVCMSSSWISSGDLLLQSTATEMNLKTEVKPVWIASSYTQNTTTAMEELFCSFYEGFLL